MSADNGIYILTTSRRGKPVYRVAYAGAIDNLEYHEQNDYTHLMKYFVDVWGASARYTDVLEAVNAANHLQRSCGGTEYGVVHINRLNYTFPGD